MKYRAATAGNCSYPPCFRVSSDQPGKIRSRFLGCADSHELSQVWPQTRPRVCRISDRTRMSLEWDARSSANISGTFCGRSDRSATATCLLFFFRSIDMMRACCCVPLDFPLSTSTAAHLHTIVTCRLCGRVIKGERILQSELWAVITS